MKKVITPVGLSLLENFLKEQNSSTIIDYINDIEDKSKKDWEYEKDKINEIRKSIEKWIKRKRERELREIINISGELKSLFKLKEELKEELKVYLLSSDTILSNLVGEIIKDLLSTKIEELKMEVEHKYIQDLQVKDREKFNKGMSNLITCIYDIANEDWNNIIINITGGYKATIPYLTILGQLSGCPVYYIFEKTDALMKIPNIPLSTEWFDWEKLKSHIEWLDRLNSGIIEENEYYKLKSSDFYKEYSFLIWEEKYLAELNPIGKIIYEKLREKIFVFESPNEVGQKILANERLLELIKKQFADRKIRESKTELKGGHFVFDAGNNPYRIFYREKEGKIIIYEAFDNHDEYLRYLKETPYDEKILEKPMRSLSLLKEA